MNKIMLFLIGTVCSLWLTGCAGPGLYYTGAECYPGSVAVNPVQAVVATGASIFEKIFHHGRYYHSRVDSPYVYRAPVVRPLPGPYIYR